MAETQHAIPDDAAGIQAIVSLADAAAKLTIEHVPTETLGGGLPEKIPIALDRRTGGFKSMKSLIEEWRETPAYREGRSAVTTLDSFIALVQRHKRAESVIFAKTNWQAPQLLAVIDYHPEEAGEESGRLKHRVGYDFPLSDEWRKWVAIHGTKLEQAEFAAFIEDHIGDVAAPIEFEGEDFGGQFQTTVGTPADLMQLSRGLQINVESAVKTAIITQSGEGRISFEETHRDADGNALKVPGIFVLNIAPFFMGEAVRVPVRLRYRVIGGKLYWFLNLHRPDIHVTKRVRADLEKVHAETELPTFEGEPEK